MFRLALISFLFFYFVVALDDSWAACYHTSGTRIYNLSSIPSGAPSCFDCPAVYQSSSTSWFYNPRSRLGVGQVDFSPCEQSAVENYCSSGSSYICNCGNSVLCSRQCYYNDYCTTKSETDSIVCELAGNNWQNDNCVPACQGKIGYGCITLPGGLNGGYTHQVYKLDSCTMTQELLEESPGSCSEIGYCNYGESKCTGSTLGGYGGSSSSPGDSVNWSSSSAYNCRNFGMIGSTCFYECDNGAYGECEAKDGICDMHAVGANCSWEIPPTSSSSPGGGASSGGTPGSSSSPGDSTGGTSSGIDYTGKLNEIIDSIHNTNVAQRNTEIATAAVNQNVKNLNTTFNTQISKVNTNLHAIQSAIESAADASAADAEQLADSIGETNSLLDKILSFFLGDSVDYDDDATYLDSVENWANSLSAKWDSGGTSVYIDSLQADTSTFRSKYNKLFISNAATRDGCYIFTMKGTEHKNTSNKFWFSDIVIDFSNVGGFNICAIVRGVVRFCAFLLCLMITISSYRSAFASTTND